MLGGIYFGESYFGSSGMSLTDSPGIIEVELYAGGLIPAWEPIPQNTELVFIVKITNLAGESREPISVSGKTISPDGKIEILIPTRSTLGIWTFSIIVGLPGKWEYEFICNGNIVAASEGDFWVANSNF